MWERPIDGESRADSLRGMPAHSHHAVVSPDGSQLVTRTFSASGRSALYLVSAGAQRGQRLLVDMPQGFAGAPVISPDGRCLAYNSDETGTYQVYVLPLAGGGARKQISTDGGTEPLWSRDGRRLFYRADGKIWSATLDLARAGSRTAGVAVSIVRRELVLAPSYRLQADLVQRSYDLSPDGKHFLMLRESDEPLRIVVVVNWTSEFRESLAAARSSAAKGG